MPQAENEELVTGGELRQITSTFSELEELLQQRVIPIFGKKEVADYSQALKLNEVGVKGRGSTAGGPLKLRKMETCISFASIYTSAFLPNC